MKSQAAIAIVSPCSHRRRTLETALIEGGADPMTLKAIDRSSALRLLATYEVGVIISDIRLRDGDWKDFLSDTAVMAQPPRLIVLAQADVASLWAEVLNLGGYDVLMEPLDVEEVRGVVASAFDAWVQARVPVSRKPVIPASALNQGASVTKPVHTGSFDRSSVLVVERDQYSRRVVESALSAEGFEVLLANNGAQAVALLQNHSSRISVVMLDNAASGMRCDDLLNRLSSIDPDVKVVVSAADRTRALLTRPHDHGFLRRPFTTICADSGIAFGSCWLLDCSSQKSRRTFCV